MNRICRACGCTDSHACTNPIDGPCWWVGEDLCSHCDAATHALAAKINVAQDFGSDLATIELRHALQLQKMVTWLLSLPTLAVVEQVKAGVDNLLVQTAQQ